MLLKKCFLIRCLNVKIQITIRSKYLFKNDISVMQQTSEETGKKKFLMQGHK